MPRIRIAQNNQTHRKRLAATLPGRAQKCGVLAMRNYLRTLTTDVSSLHDIAAPRLAEVDQLVIKYYFAQAKYFWPGMISPGRVPDVNRSLLNSTLVRLEVQVRASDSAQVTAISIPHWFD